MGLKMMLKGLGTVINKNSPTILTVMGIGGSVTAVILAVKETPRCTKLLNDARYEKSEHAEVTEFTNGLDNSSVRTTELTKKETLKCYLGAYWPAAVVETGAILCFVFANSIHMRRHAALGAALQLSENFLKEYEQHFRERFGEEQQKQFEHEINKKEMTKRESAVEEAEYKVIGNGNIKMMDKWSKQLILSSPQAIQEARNELNAMLLEDGNASLNDFYGFAGMEYTDAGEILGWHCEGKKDFVTITFDSILLPDKTPCTVFGFSPKPMYDYTY